MEFGRRLPVFQKGREAKARLLAAATESFSRKGFESSSLRAIADDAGVAFQLIPYYFGSKEDLWFAVVDALFSDLVSMGTGLTFDRSKDVQAQFLHHIRQILRYWMEKPQLKMILTQEALSANARIGRFGTPLKMWQHVTDEYFDRVVELGVVTRFSGAETYSMLRAYVASMLFTPYEYAPPIPDVSFDDPDRIEKHAQYIFCVLVHGKGSSQAQPGDIPS